MSYTSWQLMSYYFTMSCYHYRQMSWQLSKFYTPNKTSYSHDSYRSWWHHTLTSLDIDCYTHYYLWQHMTSAMTGLWHSYVILKRYHLRFSPTPVLWAVLLSYGHRTVWLVAYLVPCLISILFPNHDQTWLIFNVTVRLSSVFIHSTVLHYIVLNYLARNFPLTLGSLQCM